MNQQPIPSTDSLCLPVTPDATPDSRERLTILIASGVLYAVLAWVAWPSLNFQATALSDEAWLDALRQMSFGEALVYVGDNWWRPGESVMFWLIAHSSLMPWRVGMLAILLLTTAYLQYDCTVRGRSYLDGFGAALAFSLNPTTLTVLCWLSAANISLSAVGLLAYVAFARRALESQTASARDAVLGTLALSFALSFYELALFAPLFVFFYHRWAAPQADRRAALYVHGGSLFAVLLYLGLQAQLTELPRYGAAAAPFDLFANSMRYVVWNFWLWFNPFETFGVLISEPAADHMLANIGSFALVGGGLAIALYFRKRDPLTALSGLWFLIFLAPIGTFLRLETPVAEEHLYIPMLGVALGAVRMVTRALESLIAKVARKPLRVALEVTITVLLLWSVAPLVAECRRTVAHWSDSRELYLTTLQHYPTSTAALVGLTQELTVHAPHLRAPEEDETDAPVWKRFMDTFLLNPKPHPARELLAEGRALLHEARYDDASSALVRAFAASSTAREQLDAGKELVQALSHTALHDQAAVLLMRLRQDHPADLAELPESVTY